MSTLTRVVLGCGLAVALFHVAAAEDPAPVRRVKLTCHVSVVDQKPGESVEVWVPTPLSVASLQSVSEAGSGYVHEVLTTPSAVTWTRVVERRPFASPGSIMENRASQLSAKERRDLAIYLEPERDNAPLGDDVNEIAAGIAPGETAFVKIALGAFDYVLANMRYEKPPGKGWGHGSTRWACTEKYGNCTDFHALFMNLCRARGIPARFSMGFQIPKEPRGKIDGYHCWCEFYLPGSGWVPVDASEAWKHPEKKAYYFGNLDADRVLLVVGRDLLLTPAQKAGSISILATAYAEKSGMPVATKRELAYEDVPGQ